MEKRGRGLSVLTFWKEIPKLPFSALIFFLVVYVLWNVQVIPSPEEIVVFLESLYDKYGLVGLFIASFLEGIVYLGLYFPGSFIVFLAIFFSDGSFVALFSISIVVALAVTLTSVVNYLLGRNLSFRGAKSYEVVHENRWASKGLLFSILHPNILAFYFFHAGLERQNPWKIIFVPFLMIPYGLVIAYMLSFFRVALKSKIDNPYVMLSIILIWILVAFVFGHLSKRKQKRFEEFLD